MVASMSCVSRENTGQPSNESFANDVPSRSSTEAIRVYVCDHGQETSTTAAPNHGAKIILTSRGAFMGGVVLFRKGSDSLPGKKTSTSAGSRPEQNRS